MKIHLTYISKNLRAVTREISADGSVSLETPLIYEGDHYGAIDDTELVLISASTEHEGVYFEFAEGRDPDGAPAFQYVEETVLVDPKGFYEAMVEVAREVPDLH